MQRGGFYSWSQGSTVAAAVFRVMGATALWTAAVVFANAGLVPSRGNNGPADGTQAIVNSVIIAVIAALLTFVWLRNRRNRASRVKGSRYAEGDRMPYDRWFLRATPKPLAVLVVLADIRALCHFYAPSVQNVVEGLVVGVALLVVTWAFVIGPVWRPEGPLLMSSPGFDSWSERHQRTDRSAAALPRDQSKSASSGTVTLMDSVRTRITHVQFRLTLNGYNVDEVDNFLADLAQRIEIGDTISGKDLSDLSFDRSLKGYETQEVDAFVQVLASQLNSG